MSVINITDIIILNNPGRFDDPYTFKITFECMSELSDGRQYIRSLCAFTSCSLERHRTRIFPSVDIEWKLIYVGSAENESYDQELDTCMVGPVPVGVNSFEFEVNLL